jgi:glutamate-ammonia-ligase adenylyltransferase
MRIVSGIYDRIIFSQRRRQKRAGEATAKLPSASSAREMSFDQVLEHIVQDSAELHEIAARSYPIHTRRNLHRFLSSAMTSSERYAALLENPTAVEKAIPLLAASDYLADILVRHPDAIRGLDMVFTQQDESPAPELWEKLLSASTDSVHSVRPLDALRRSYRKFSFAIGARDVIAPRPGLQSMRETSALAEIAIGKALKIGGAEDTLAIFALGRLGTSEFDIASDADLIFLRGADSDEDRARAAAEKLIHALAAYTREGLIFAVDARLRPHGNEGELVITPAQLERYLGDEARPWEALSYTKLRFIAGRNDLSFSIPPLVWDKIMSIAARPSFAEAVLEMRARLEKSNRFPHSFKLARGGFYDIDFVASFLMLRGGSPISGNTLERLDQLCRAGLLEQSVFQRLRDATLLYRTADHVIRFVTGRARPELPAAEHARHGVEILINRILGRSETADIQQALEATAGDVRAIFQEIFARNRNLA